MKFAALLLFTFATGCAMTPEQQNAFDAFMKGAQAQQARQDAINAERAALRAANRPRRTHCFQSGQNIDCTTY